MKSRPSVWRRYSTSRRNASQPWTCLFTFFFGICTLLTLQSHSQTKSTMVSYFSQESWFLNTLVNPPKIDVAMIPHTIWFTYKYNILMTKTPEHYYKNVLKTIDAYTSLWNTLKSPPAEVYFLDDDNCTKLLNQVEPLLAKAFQEEQNGSLKADLCRTAALYLHGGYYFDIDMEVVQPLNLANNISFSTSSSATAPLFFNSFLAASPRNTILSATISSFYQYYINKTGPCQVNLFYQAVVGCCTLWEGFQMTPIEKRGEILILDEVHLSAGFYPNQPGRGPGDYACDYVVHDNASHQIYFYSRIRDSDHCQAENNLNYQRDEMKA